MCRKYVCVYRFSKDVYTVDEQIPSTLRGYFGTLLRVRHWGFRRPLSSRPRLCVCIIFMQVLGVILYICAVTPLFLLGLGPIGAFYYFAQR